MLALYLGAFVLAAGIFVVQMVHDGEQPDDLDHDADHEADHENATWALVLTVRFWSFALLAFGLVGAALTLFALAGGVVTFALAVAMGTGSGFFATLVLRRIRRTSPSSHATSADLVGRLGRVLVPMGADARGKIRVEVKGLARDFVATSREPLETGDTVVVEEALGGEVVVSRAPRELEP